MNSGNSLVTRRLGLLESVRLVMVSPLALRSEGLSHNDDNDRCRVFMR
jgi:hypothetical protein